MPSKYNPDKFFVWDGSKPVPRAIFETYACPKCSHRVAVEKQHIDYKQLYEMQCRVTEGVLQSGGDLIEEIRYEIPEAEIYLHNKKAQLMNNFQKMIDKLRGNEI